MGGCLSIKATAKQAPISISSTAPIEFNGVYFGQNKLQSIKGRPIHIPGVALGQ
jgi:hypothetical protein